VYKDFVLIITALSSPVRASGFLLVDVFFFFVYLFDEGGNYFCVPLVGRASGGGAEARQMCHTFWRMPSRRPRGCPLPTSCPHWKIGLDRRYAL